MIEIGFYAAGALRIRILINSFVLSVNSTHTHQEEFFRVMRKRGNAPLDDIDSDDDF